jgi:hypothetical protein
LGEKIPDFEIGWKNTRLAGKIPDWMEQYQMTLLKNQSTNLVFPMKNTKSGLLFDFLSK